MECLSALNAYEIYISYIWIPMSNCYTYTDKMLRSVNCTSAIKQKIMIDIIL